MPEKVQILTTSAASCISTEWKHDYINICDELQTIQISIENECRKHHGAFSLTLERNGAGITNTKVICGNSSIKFEYEYNEICRSSILNE